MSFFPRCRIFSAVFMHDWDYLIVSGEFKQNEIARFNFQIIRRSQWVDHLFLTVAGGYGASIVRIERNNVNAFPIDGYEVFVLA